MSSLDKFYLPQVTADGANGVGAVKVKQLASHMEGMLDIRAVFDGSKGILNHEVSKEMHCKIR